MSGLSFTRDDVKVLSTDMPGDQRGQWWHIQIGDRYFVVSAVDLSFGGFVIDGYRTSETMAFSADAEGEVTDWGELAMVPYKDHEACIADLLDELSTPVPVSEGSQVSGEEVGPATNGPNLAATGAGAAAVPPVPVVAQPPRCPAPGSEIPDMPGYVVGECGHRMAGSEWRAGFRTCERCPWKTPPVPVVAPSEISDETDCPHLADILAGRATGIHDDSTCGWCAVIRSSTVPLVPVVAEFGDSDPEWAAIVARTEDLADVVMDAYLLGIQRGVARATEPRWGSGPLVDHNPETPAAPGTGSADPDGGQR